MSQPHMSRHTGIFDPEINYPSTCAWEDEETGEACGQPAKALYFCPSHEDDESADYPSQYERADLRFNPDADQL